MKIMAAILFLIMGVLLVQPLFALKENTCCTHHCCKEKEPNKNDCPNNCNPLFCCICSAYTMPGIFTLTNNKYIIKKDFPPITNNSIVKGFLVSCWHPPDVDV